MALGLAAIVIAGSVYLNEHQEHKATVDFHQATHQLLAATAAGLRSPQGRALEASSAHEVEEAEDHQEKAANYTLAEVILATSLFLFGVAGISSDGASRSAPSLSQPASSSVAIVVLASV